MRRARGIGLRARRAPSRTRAPRRGAPGRRGSSPAPRSSSAEVIGDAAPIARHVGIAEQTGELTSRLAPRPRRAPAPPRCRPGPSTSSVMPCSTFIGRSGSTRTRRSRVRVRVDEARAPRQPAAVDDARILGDRQVGRDGGDAPVAHQHVGAPRRRAGPVDDACRATNHEISFLNAADRPVRLGTAVAEELPGVAHLADHVEIHVGDHELVLVAARLRR